MYTEQSGAPDARSMSPPMHSTSTSIEVEQAPQQSAVFQPDINPWNASASPSALSNAWCAPATVLTPDGVPPLPPRALFSDFGSCSTFKSQSHSPLVQAPDFGSANLAGTSYDNGYGYGYGGGYGGGCGSVISHSDGIGIEANSTSCSAYGASRVGWSQKAEEARYEPYQQNSIVNFASHCPLCAEASRCCSSLECLV